MVLSCLVEPLVAPLVGPRRTAIRRSRLAATALAASALMAIACPAQASEVASGNAKAAASRVRNAHKKPAPIPLRVVVAQHTQVAVRRDEAIRLAAPGEAAAFEQEALLVHRLLHRRKLETDLGFPLGLGRAKHRLCQSMARAFLLFGSGQLRAGAPALV